ncbi:hypothetical protein LWI28_013653 [Acer negundo]|uniref:Uncharacterized protein n=1 Tax=Acer negundo TaxID=4023 RepID=A0AAD5NML1_ACENE|nr:hypothetical protein LWI28_013653 [Acer negundo]
MVAAFLSCGGNDEAVKSNLVELQGHIMHGVFHSNGFGHLLCLNGVETGSDLTGQHLMHFWDRLCTGLRARKVSLYDISRKRGMELRLLHAVAYGEPWFGRWGYKFGRGSFGVTQPMYQKAIEAIQATPLCLLINHIIGTSNQEITLIFSRYQTLSDYSLVTLGDLFHFLLELKPRLPKENCIGTYNPGVLVETTCRWSAKRVDMATRVIVEALKRAESRWVSRQEVRDVARAYIGDTGLLDFVLKSLGNHIVGKYLVRRSLNPVTKVLEYSLEDISNIFPDQDLLLSNSKMKTRYKITGIQLMKDMRNLFKYIFKDQKQTLNSGIISGISVAARIILDTKYFVKEYCGDFDQLSSKVELGLEGKLKLFCTVLLRNIENPNEVTKNTILSYECVTLKNNATFDELKLEVERRFRGLYWGLRSFVIESVVNLNAKGTDLVFGVVEVGRKIIFEGSNKERGISHELMYENGVLNCIVVDCPCGTQEDDGERMISCDICEVWQHSRSRARILMDIEENGRFSREVVQNQKERIDVGKLVQLAPFNLGKRENVMLSFPCLITFFYEREGVQRRPYEKISNQDQSCDSRTFNDISATRDAESLLLVDSRKRQRRQHMINKRDEINEEDACVVPAPEMRPTWVDKLLQRPD